jgi:Mrp family chromosome partitioning ATPase/uncharacterized protein involved in exopolysaccharide biosynthesis
MRQVSNHGPGSGENASESGAVTYPFDPWRIVRRALVGRYRLACFFGLIVGGMGAVIGWALSTPIYKSEGMIRIASSAPQLGDESDAAHPMAMFDAYLQSQQIVLTSRDVLESAVTDKAWLALGRKASPLDIQLLANNLKVEFKPHTDYLRVYFTDHDAATAAAGVRAVINSYEKTFIAQQANQRHHRLNVLEDRRATLTKRLEKLESDLRARVSQTGGSELESLQFLEMKAIKIDSALADVRHAIATAPRGSNPLVPMDGHQPTLAQMAATDSLLRGYLAAQAKRDDEVSRLRGIYGEEHPKLVEAREAAQRGQDQIDEYFRLTRAQPNTLKTEEASLLAQQEKIKKEMIAQGADRFGLDRLRVDEDALRKDLADITRKLEAIDTEELLGGRLTVMSRGDVPLMPLLNRNLRDAAVGFVGGFICPGAILVICSLVRPRYRSCIQAASELADLVPMFTSVLKLKEDLATSTGSRATARSVHQMRVKLCSTAKDRTSSVYMVTSAGSGEGKTTLALSLGASFAAAGFRTLIIDADMAGRGATIGLGVEGLPGLREAAECGTLKDHVRGTPDGLCILPTGADDQFNAYAIPQAAIEHLIEEAREMFQVVILDTGAVFNCIEASMLAPWSDGVLFVVARGQRESLVEQSLQHLASLEAKLVGVVFNGAHASDYERAMRTKAPENFFNRAQVAKPIANGPTVITGFGPVVDSVVSSLPIKQVGEFELLYQSPTNTPIPPPAPPVKEAA